MDSEDPLEIRKSSLRADEWWTTEGQARGRANLSCGLFLSLTPVFSYQMNVTLLQPEL